MIRYISKCRCCNHKDLKTIIDLNKQPIQGSFIYPNKIEPPKVEIDSVIKLCNPKTGGCGLVQNLVTVDPSILYSNYGYRSSISDTMKKHLNEIVNNVINFLKQNNIEPTRVLDIGANDLYLLQQYKSNIEKIGIDPSDIINENKIDNIKTINDFYPSIKIDGKFDIISSIACFYDIDDPINFCKHIESNLKDNGIWICEFAYLKSVINNLAYDGMVHEHLCLYSIGTFENILKKTGLKILKIEENDTNNGSLQVWVIKENNSYYQNENFKKDILNLKIKELNQKLDDIQIYENFMTKINDHKHQLVKLLKAFKSQNKKIHIYGMSTKLNTILSYCKIGPELIDYAAERSKEKVGAKTISGIPIISEEDSRKIADIYLVGPYHFKNEIVTRENETIQRGIKFIFPLPAITII
jgi:SAM-dependent methyltransferase